MARLRSDGSVRSLVERYLVDHPDAAPKEVAAMLGHKGSSAAVRALREVRGWSSEQDKRYQERARGANGAAHRAPGGVRRDAEAYLASVPDPDAVTGPELAAHLGHKSPTTAYEVLRQIRAEREAPVPVSPSPNAPARRSARGAPDVLGAILGQFGPVNGADLAGMLLPAPGLHNHGFPLVRDHTGQVFELHELGHGLAARVTAE